MIKQQEEKDYLIFNNLFDKTQKIKNKNKENFINK